MGEGVYMCVGGVCVGRRECDMCVGEVCVGRRECDMCVAVSACVQDKRF